MTEAWTAAACLLPALDCLKQLQFWWQTICSDCSLHIGTADHHRQTRGCCLLMTDDSWHVVQQKWRQKCRCGLPSSSLDRVSWVAATYCVPPGSWACQTHLLARCCNTLRPHCVPTVFTQWRLVGVVAADRCRLSFSSAKTELKHHLAPAANKLQCCVLVTTTHACCPTEIFAAGAYTLPLQDVFRKNRAELSGVEQGETCTECFITSACCAQHRSE